MSKEHVILFIALLNTEPEFVRLLKKLQPLGQIFHYIYKIVLKEVEVMVSSKATKLILL